jgi:cyclic di-GMP phosphodiesterase
MSITEPSYEELKARVAELEKDLERSNDITLEALGDAMDLKNVETEGHSKRVTAFTVALARAMTVPGEKIRVIARGAFLHDIGKMAIPDSILRKPGALTQEEIAIMQEHCYRGYQMLRKIPFLKEAAEIVYAHEERWDGTGYPRGLKGNEIPLGARLFAVVDTLDMTMSDQYNRAAQPFSAARDEIVCCSGRQFDPDVVKVFLTIPESIWHDLRKHIDQQIYRFTFSQKVRG